MTQNKMTGPRRMPGDVRLARGALLVVAAVHLLAIVLLLVNQAAVAEGTSRTNYTGPSQVVVHIVLAVLFALAAAVLPRRWGRVAATVLLGLQLLAHATLPLVVAMLPAFAAQIVLVQLFSLVFEVAALWLLWGSRASREHYRAAYSPGADD
jgi:hypothetical protein